MQAGRFRLRGCAGLLALLALLAVSGCGSGTRSAAPRRARSATAPPASAGSRTGPGDLNGLGHPDVGSATKVLRVVVGLASAPTDITAWDCNGSGRVDVGDATKILRWVVGLEQVPVHGVGNVVLESHTQTLTGAGGEVAAADAGVRLLATAGALTAAASVQLDVYTKPFAGLAPTGFTPGEHGVELTLPTGQLAPGAALQLELPDGGHYDPLGSMVIAASSDGTALPLRVTHDEPRGLLVADLTGADLAVLGSGAAPGRSVLSRATLMITSLFIAASTAEAAGHLVRLYPPESSGGGGGGGGSWRATTPDWSNKRIALLVHGIFNQITDLTTLAHWLGGEASGPNQMPGVFDEVWGYDYNWKAPIADNGALFAQQVRPLAATAADVEIVAHSMGGLVSRWALEQAGLGDYVHHLITLGTPHEGVPLQAIQALLRVVGSKTGIDVATIMPGVSDLCAVQVHLPWSSPTFLERLNAGTSPYVDTADYFALAGDAWGEYDYGLAVNAFYSELGWGGDEIIHDGIVTQPSAVSGVLSSKSASWQTNSDLTGGFDMKVNTVHLSHSALKGSAVGSPQWQILTRAIRPWLGLGNVAVQVGRQQRAGRR